jgi:hypothetical protein
VGETPTEIVSQTPLAMQPRPQPHRRHDIEIIHSELRLVAALRRAARERGGPLPSIDVADALLDERRELMSGYNP